MYSRQDVIDFVREEDVKFIRLVFCDVFGKQKNISIMPGELERAFDEGISFDASAIRGFSDVTRSDLFLVPDPSTLAVLPWRPAHGRVVRMFCNIFRPDGSRYEKDGRYILQQAYEAAKEKGFECSFGSELEFYLFKTDENGLPTGIPFDNAGYMDIAPEDKGENVRRSVCLTLEEMGISPESSHHEEGPGQNEIDFRYAAAPRAADDCMTFKTVVRTCAMMNGLYASLSPKPVTGESGNGFHINISVKSDDGSDRTNEFMAGVLEHIADMTLFLNPTEESYRRLGENKAPKYITWSKENRSPLIRIPASESGKRIELRSPDPEANPYLAYALLIRAGIDGIEKGMSLQASTDFDLFSATEEQKKGLRELPNSLGRAVRAARDSEFIAGALDSGISEAYFTLKY